MAWFQDLSRCTYFPGDTSKLLAIGWLENGHPFDVGPVPADFVARLHGLLEDPWTPTAFFGMHFCDLCPDSPPAGARDLFVPAADAVFVAPVLIEHYVEAHHYRPPGAFIRAVAACPPMSSPEYLAAVARHYRGA